MPGMFSSVSTTLKNMFNRNRIGPTPRADVSEIPAATATMDSSSGMMRRPAPAYPVGASANIQIAISVADEENRILRKIANIREQINLLQSDTLMGEPYDIPIPMDMIDYNVRERRRQIIALESELRQLRR